MDRSEVEKISKALADETRLRIFEAISATNHMNCGEIVSMRGVTPATVSHHLKILSEAGLIACRREGQFVYSQAVPETISAYTRAILKIGRGKKTTRAADSRKSVGRISWKLEIRQPHALIDHLIRADIRRRFESLGPAVRHIVVLSTSSLLTPANQDTERHDPSTAVHDQMSVWSENFRADL